MECRKCGMELHPDQKVCIRCGTRTIKGGGFDYGIKDPWRPTPKMITIGVGVAVLFLVAIVLHSLRTIPPEIVAQDWFTSMTQRKVNSADKLVTQGFKDDLMAKQSDSTALSDDLYTEVTNEEATFSVGKPKYDNPKKPGKAVIKIMVKSPDGTSQREHQLDMVKLGRQWKIEKEY